MENRPRYRFVRVIARFFHLTYNVTLRVVTRKAAQCALLVTLQISQVGSWRSRPHHESRRRDPKGRIAPF